MKQAIVVVGIGEMGSVFARGFLRLGHPVYPVTRTIDMQDAAKTITDPLAVFIAVAEQELPGVLKQIPSEWRDKLCLLQNELLPRDWAGVQAPTVISVWFEKKRGMDTKVIIPSPVFGPHAQLLADALGTIAIQARVLNNPDELLFELVVKNLYILTSNIAGLKTGGTVGELWQNHQTFAREVATDIITLQEAMTESYLDHDKLITAMVDAFNGDPQHQCMGRSAPARLERALINAKQFDLHLPALLAIATERS